MHPANETAYGVRVWVCHSCDAKQAKHDEFVEGGGNTSGLHYTTHLSREGGR